MAYDGLVETTPGTIITRDMWRWAWTIVASRSFSFTYVGGAMNAQVHHLRFGSTAKTLQARARKTIEFEVEAREGAPHHCASSRGSVHCGSRWESAGPLPM